MIPRSRFIPCDRASVAQQGATGRLTARGGLRSKQRCSSVIFSENRYTLFGIMLQLAKPISRSNVVGSAKAANVSRAVR